MPELPPPPAAPEVESREVEIDDPFPPLCRQCREPVAGVDPIRGICDECAGAATEVGSTGDELPWDVGGESDGDALTAPPPPSPPSEVELPSAEPADVANVLEAERLVQVAAMRSRVAEARELLPTVAPAVRVAPEFVTLHALATGGELVIRRSAVEGVRSVEGPRGQEPRTEVVFEFGGGGRPGRSVAVRGSVAEVRTKLV